MYKLIILVMFCFQLVAQEFNASKKWFLLGMRSTASIFSQDGAGIGVGGQFRIQFNPRLNSDWFADYITINVQNKVKSEYAHIGWSILFYPFTNMLYPKIIQPYILAGHCFDFNKKTSITEPSQYKERWGSAVQAGIGSHINITERLDITLMTQYMIHLTSEIDFEETAPDKIIFHQHSQNTLEGHFLFTTSINYKIFSYGK